MLARKIIESLNVSPIYFIVAFNLSQNLSLIAGICIYDCKPIQLRSLAETAMMRFKQTFSDKLKARTLQNQQAEVRVKCSILNKMIQIAAANSFPLPKIN